MNIHLYEITGSEWKINILLENQYNVSRR